MSLEQKIAELMEQAKQLESIKSEEIEESEILDEMKQGQSYSQKQIEQKIKSGDWEAVTDIKPGKHVELRHHTGKRVQVHVKEEVEQQDESEQLDELSKQTLGKYINRATDRTAAHAYIAGGGTGQSDENKKKEFGNAVKRIKGVRAATARLTKEEQEMKIDLGSLFEGEEFSEEFKTTAQEMFEAAVEARVKQEVESLAEELEAQSLQESEQLKEGLVDKVDGYLDYVVEQWMNENALALDRGIKLEIFESFVSGMKDLLESHYIEAPDEKFDLMEAVDAKAKTLEEKLDEATAEIVGLKAELKQIAKEKQIQEATEGLSDLEAERLKQLAEELAYDDEETFTKKLDVIKENMVKTPKQKTIVESVVTDSPVELKEETQLDPTMARYLKAIR